MPIFIAGLNPRVHAGLHTASKAQNVTTDHSDEGEIQDRLTGEARTRFRHREE